MTRPLAPPQVIDPSYYAEHGYPHTYWAELRRTNPIAWCATEELIPFWAVTGYQHIVEISKRPLIYQSAPMMAVRPNSGEWDELPLRQLLNMDPPEHREYRRIMSQYFTKNRLRKSEGKFAKVAEDLVARVLDKPSFDFVTEISSVLPLAIIAELMGLPVDDRDQFFRWTNEILGAHDPEFQREDGSQGRELIDKAIGEFFVYASDMVADRRAHPRDDLVSVLANARIGDDYLPTFELMSYIVLLVAAGNETTRNATSGGLLALIEHPDQMARLKSQPGLLDAAIEEIVRFTSPVIHFCRTPNEDIKLGDVEIAAGESMALFYPSANRDEDIFEDPNSFRIDRTPNSHLGFGIGEHLCLGAHLARAELRAMFAALLPRLDEIELAGEPERLFSNFVGGIKHLPVHARFRS